MFVEVTREKLGNLSFVYIFVCAIFYVYVSYWNVIVVSGYFSYVQICSKDVLIFSVSFLVKPF